MSASAVTNIAVAVALIVIGLLIAGGLALVRAATVRVWRDTDGRALRQGTVMTAALWIIALATHIGIDAVIDISDRGAAALGSASILLYLAVSLGVQREVIRSRAARLS